MSIKEFLSDNNIKLLWDLITEEELFKNKSNDIKHNISQVFINNIEPFYHSEKTIAKTLVEMNKKYMISVLNFIKQIKPKHEPPKQEPNKLLEPQKLTQETYQNERISKFEKDYERRQNEFESAMTLPKPKVPEFSDKMTDEPLKNMEDILKQMTAQRNYDIYNIAQSQQNANINPNFLKPLETSIKNEKLMQKEFAETTMSKKLQPLDTRENLPSNNGIRYIKIADEELDNNIINAQVIELPHNDSPKKLTWGENQVYYQENEDIDLFKRLKKQPPSQIQETMPDFQKQIDDLNMKVDNINININMILDLLRTKSEIL
jgi:hypothetical protein